MWKSIKQGGITRRETVRSLVAGGIVLPGMLSELMGETAARAETASPLAPQKPHFAGKAKRVIFLYMHGGVSQMESFDPKPRLAVDHDKAYGDSGSHGKRNQRKLLRPYYGFKKYGQSGMDVSELFPHVGQHADELCLIRSMRTDSMDHTEAALGLHTGSYFIPRPSMGSWVSYGLGTENRNLPSFVSITPLKPSWGGNRLWASDFLPGYHQGTQLLPGEKPIAHLQPAVAPDLQETELGLIEALNKSHVNLRGGRDAGLLARLKSYETAFKMQVEAPEAFDLSKESDATLKMYGLERGSTDGYAWQCLMARRLCERGVRFVELIDCGAGTDGSNWDAHHDITSHAKHALNVDRPIAALLTDLKQRGMLEDTLVVWTTEFGRTAYTDPPQGRGHHPQSYCSWLAGAGVKQGLVYGETDEYAMKVVDKPVHVHDFQATILHLLGLDHTRLTYRHGGRDFRLTDVHGHVVHDLLT